MFAEDPAVFLRDFGLPCVANGVAFTGILDQPDDVLQHAGVNQLSTMYELTVSAASVGAAALRSGVSLTVAGLAYVIRDVMSVDDGAFFHLTLSR